MLDEAIAKIVAAAKRNGKFLGRPAQNPEEVKKYSEQGFQVLQCMTELGFMTAGAKSMLEAVGIKPLAQEKRALY